MKDGVSVKRGRRGLVLAVAVLVLGAVVYVQRTEFLTMAALTLAAEDPLERADVIFVLSGGIDTRPYHAAGLYRHGFGRKIVLARAESRRAVRLGLVPNETDLTVRLLAKLGVPDSAIVVLRIPGGVTSTRDEARAFRAFVEANGVERAILVSSAHHGRRAKWIFARALGGLPVDLRMSSAAEAEFNEGNWWKVEDGLMAYAAEYLKLLHNFVYR